MAVAEMWDGGGGRQVKREDTGLDKHGIRDMGQQGHRQWRGGNIEMAAAQMWDNKKRDVVQQRCWFEQS